MRHRSRSGSIMNQKYGGEGNKVKTIHKNNGERDISEAGGGSLTCQQQKAIIEQLLITKNSSPQKNYSHVPCKFYLQGNCQAGESCPFSHSLNSSVADKTPCKYFQKGNCKFGMKCANAHVLANGTRVNPRRWSTTNSVPGKSFNQGMGQGVEFVESGSYMMAQQGEETGANSHREGTSLAINFTNYTPAVNSNAASALNFSSFRQPATSSSMMSIPQGLAHGFPISNTSFFNSIDNNSMNMNVQASYAEGLQTEESMLLPSELSDLLTPMEARRRETFKNLSYSKLASSQHGSFSSSVGDPQLSYSSSSSSSDYSWRNVINSNQNIDYWHNMENLESDMTKFTIDEHEEDNINTISTKTEKSSMTVQNESTNQDNSVPAPTETQFFFDDLYGGIY